MLSKGTFLIIGCYVVAVSSTFENSLTLTGCQRGPGCSQCPQDRYTNDGYGEMLCCPGCAKALLYYGDTPDHWCVCYVEPQDDSSNSRTIKFPTGNSRFSSSSSHNDRPTSSFVFSSDNPQLDFGGATDEHIRDAMFILNGNRGGEVSLAVHEALTLMASTIETLNARITRLEDIIFHAGLGHGHVTDRLGAAVTSPGGQSSEVQGMVPPPIPPSSEEPCPGVNFTRVGEKCYHVSVWRDHRAIWEEASKACENMNAKLAEPVESSSFIALTQYLSLAASTTGYSYWIGAFYPGVSWLWSYAGEKVTLNPSYWTGVDANNKRVDPGDTASGRCLSFSYLQRASNYFYGAAECGYEKYYVCEQIPTNF
ncbi:hypothetical protein SK128_018388 [Halocaridina rubra]|uniref:C-type lectin domain-containing protein n=1 Tax=Halocaridina rubra TaxID=373956 RepID=A0AAN9A243_HALRR